MNRARRRRGASFRQVVQDRLDLLTTYGIADEDFRTIQPPIYPEPGGLFPFMIDSDGMNYFWRMEPSDPESWPLFRWEVNVLRPLKYATLAEMFLDDIA